MVQQCDGFPIVPHLFQVLDGFLLIIPEFDCLTHLNRKVCFKCLEHWAAAQKCNQLILDLFRLLFQLTVNPAVNLPVIINQTVLLQKVICILVLGNLTWVVVSFSVYLDCNFGFRRFQRKVDVAMPTIDINTRILNLQIFCFLRAECFTEQLNKQFFRTAIDAGCF